jgi:hypothetical protein
MYSTSSDLELMSTSSSKNMNSFGICNYHNGSFHPHLIQKSINDDEIILEKFQSDTLVKLETGEIKNIQQLTTNDFLISTKQSPQYSG